ncbi:MAG: protein involved in polysaccharide export with SLBB domain [Pseudoalteromonas tetraodonis]|jgi:protein involved in polysaccharide export with SLBB domain
MLSFLLVSCGDKQKELPAIVEPARVGDQPTKPTPGSILPGEQLDVFVMEDDSFSGRFQVRSSGHIIVPKLGRVKVGGLSIASAESSLKRALEESQLKEATVILDRAAVPGAENDLGDGSGVEILLSGKVAHPGRYTVSGIGDQPATILRAIIQAGGCSRFAYKKKVHILRRSDDGRLVRIDADLLAIETGQARDITLAPGDIIVIPEKKVDFGI